MAAIGHPILGDFFYGQLNATAVQNAEQAAVSPLDASELQRPVNVRNAYERADRLLLHAEELHLVHPRTLVAMSFRATCPFNLKDYC